MSNPITIGHIARAHGLKGDVAVVFYSDHPEQFAAGFQLGGTGGSLTIEWVRSGAGVAIVKFAGVDDRDGAELLKGVQLTMEESDLRTLEEGEFWPSQLQGLEVRDRSGTKRGVVRDVILAALRIGWRLKSLPAVSRFRLSMRSSQPWTSKEDL